MRRLPLAVAIIAAAATIAGCREVRHSYVPNASDTEHIPTMTTTDVETFISDSGYTRYKITTPLWEMYDEAMQPHWRFPDGLFLQQYDEHLKPDASVTCDSARYNTRERIWQLDGHVVMVNTARDSFITAQLFWDQMNATVYSDSFIHIVRSDRIIEGYGFQSNQNMTRYTVNHPTGIIPVQRPAANGASSQAAADSLQVDQSGRRPAPVRASERQPQSPDNPNLIISSPVKFAPKKNN
jgi:LPS export ABC transporter protein LptC